MKNKTLLLTVIYTLSTLIYKASVILFGCLGGVYIAFLITADTTISWAAGIFIYLILMLVFKLIIKMSDPFEDNSIKEYLTEALTKKILEEEDAQTKNKKD